MKTLSHDTIHAGILHLRRDGDYAKPERLEHERQHQASRRQQLLLYRILYVYYITSAPFCNLCSLMKKRSDALLDLNCGKIRQHLATLKESSPPLWIGAYSSPWLRHTGLCVTGKIGNGIGNRSPIISGSLTPQMSLTGRTDCSGTVIKKCIRK